MCLCVCVCQLLVSAGHCGDNGPPHITVVTACVVCTCYSSRASSCYQRPIVSQWCIKTSAKFPEPLYGSFLSTSFMYVNVQNQVLSTLFPLFISCVCIYSTNCTFPFKCHHFLSINISSCLSWCKSDWFIDWCDLDVSVLQSDELSFSQNSPGRIALNSIMKP